MISIIQNNTGYAAQEQGLLFCLQNRPGRLQNKTMLIYLNDRLVDEEDARVSVYDHGFLYGDGIYETMRAYEGVVFMLEEHLRRLQRSALLIRLSLPPEEYIIDAVQATLQANALSDAYIRITISRGKGPIGLDPALCNSPTLVIIAEPFHGYPPAYY
ncbi:MAG: hypothetical protein EPN25_14745, partial [Nitrospirae bacterium]